MWPDSTPLLKIISGFQTEPLNFDSNDYGFPGNYSANANYPYELHNDHAYYALSKSEQPGPSQIVDSQVQSGQSLTVESLPRTISNEDHITLVPSEIKQDVDHQLRAHIPPDQTMAPHISPQRRASAPQVQEIPRNAPPPQQARVETCLKFRAGLWGKFSGPGRPLTS